MRSFEFYAPTKVEFGAGVEGKAGELVGEFGGKKALVHFGGQSAKRSGVLDRVTASLDAQGIGHVLFGGAQPNPHVSLAREGAKLAKDEGVDFILAVGGGSVVDSAKAIAYGAMDDEGDLWDFYERTRTPKACLPVGVVLTVVGAGSEMSGVSVLTEGKSGKKRSVETNIAKPKFALLNPELTLTVSPQQTAAGCVDIIMHALERYFTPDERMYVTAAMDEALIRTVMYNARVLKKNPADLEARSDIMWAATMAHNDAIGPRSWGDWACHQLEHELSGMFGVTHGAGLAAIWGTWARYVLEANPSRFERLAIRVLRLNYSPEAGTALALQGIEAMEAFFEELGMPTSIHELGVNPSPKQLQSLARSCSHDGARTIGQFKVLDEADMLAIYEKAL